MKDEHLRDAEPINKVTYDSKIHVINHALGLHTSISRVRGGKLKAKHEIRVATMLKEVPLEFLRMIAVHELALASNTPTNNPQVLAQVSLLIEQKRLGEILLKRYPTPHQIRNDSALYSYTQALKSNYLSNAEPVNKVVYNNKIHVINHALGLHTAISRVQVSRSFNARSAATTVATKISVSI